MAIFLHSCFWLNALSFLLPFSLPFFFNSITSWFLGGLGACFHSNSSFLLKSWKPWRIHSYLNNCKLCVLGRKTGVMLAWLFFLPLPSSNENIFGHKWIPHFWIPFFLKVKDFVSLTLLKPSVLVPPCACCRAGLASSGDMLYMSAHVPAVPTHSLLCQGLCGDVPAFQQGRECPTAAVYSLAEDGEQH